MSNNELDTTIDDWRAEMGRLQPNDPGLSMVEIADEIGMSLSTTCRKIRHLLKSGKCKQGFAIRTDAIGRRQRIPVYQLIPEKKVDNK